MMACEMCEHCQSPISRNDITVWEGFSYHKKCHKCYVCSETDLRNAEMFKGVIFCSSCATRIFQGCATARRAKNMHNGRVKRTRSRSKSLRRRDRSRVPESRRLGDGSRDGVIEMAGMNVSTSESDDLKKKKSSVASILKDMTNVRKEIHEENCYYIHPLKQLKRDSTEMGTTTDVTQELLRQINCPVPEYRAKTFAANPTHTPRKHYKKKELYESNHKPLCSDLRIAELGASTEIANMALRKKSEMPVIIKSDTRLRDRESYSLSVLNQESDSSIDGQEWMDSNYNSIEDLQRIKWMDRKLGSIMKLPLNFFKKNILNRSSLISVLMSSSDEKTINLYKRLKEIFFEEVTEHQGRGVRRLYSSINRRKKPHKLGWVQLVAKVSKVLVDQSQACANTRRCNHFRTSHSYRCMRAQVMKLAGPTKSELACYRKKIKQIVAPQFLRNIVTSNKSYPAIKMSQCCGSDRKS